MVLFFVLITVGILLILGACFWYADVILRNSNVWSKAAYKRIKRSLYYFFGVFVLTMTAAYVLSLVFRSNANAAVAVTFLAESVVFAVYLFILQYESAKRKQKIVDDCVLEICTRYTEINLDIDALVKLCFKNYKKAFRYSDVKKSIKRLVKKKNPVVWKQWSKLVSNNSDESAKQERQKREKVPKQTKRKNVYKKWKKEKGRETTVIRR
jgi:Ca2+/Na+ antiporter